MAGKKSLAQKELDEFDAVFKALAHPTRRYILVVLRSKGDRMSAGEIVSSFSHTWPTITRHLKRLEKAGLVTVNKVSTQQFYNLNKGKMAEVLKNWLKWF